MPSSPFPGSIYVSPGVTRLYATYAVEFGLRVLRHLGDGSRLEFESLRRAAEDMMREDPKGTALYLASLVALDMKRVLDEDEASAPTHAQPSRN